MKLKCNDKIVRNFEPSHFDGDYKKDKTRYNSTTESYCKGCKRRFGVHDTRILKQLWKKHKCKKNTRYSEDENK